MASEEIFQEMIRSGISPNESTIINLLNVFSHAGQPDKALALFHSVETEHKLKPTLDMCNCVVDSLSRCGRLTEAENFIAQMPTAPDVITWTSLLSGCRIHKNVDCGVRAAEAAMKIQPNNISLYILLANTYGAAGRWQDYERIFQDVGKRGLKKIPGRSEVIVNGEYTSFTVGDKTHQEAIAIHAKNADLHQHIKQLGYVPNTSCVFKSFGEEQSTEEHLCSHR